jgi:hypothetical protein
MGAGKTPKQREVAKGEKERVKGTYSPAGKDWKAWGRMWLTTGAGRDAKQSMKIREAKSLLCAALLCGR